MNVPYVQPTFDLEAFNCPFCGAFAAQKWIGLWNQFPSGHLMEAESKKFHMAWCSHCRRVATWYEKMMLVPDTATAPMPHVDMPEGVKSDFNEARSVLQRSPRSAAALLRLSIQKLCKELGEEGSNINDAIASLVAKGLPVEVQQSLDIVRVVGNEQVHPGELDVRDDPSIAAELFKLVNFIVEDRISRPKAIKALYDRLPAKKLEGIKQRDS